MTIEQIKELLQTSDYHFLRENSHLKNMIVLLTLGGSYSYGTNTETSDVDIRGCALNSRTDLFGLTKFEQVVNTQTDTTVYSINKLITMLLDCNPNVIEILGCKPEHYLYLDVPGEMLIENRKLFLSHRAVDAYCGYATRQLRRLENALAHDKLPQGKREEHMLKSLEGSLKSFKDRYTQFDNGAIKMYTAESTRDDLDREIFLDVDLKKFPARQFNSMINDLHNVITTYDKLNHRNNKKDDNHLNKHAMHLVRLYLICLDILEKGDIITYRGDDLDLLMSIRRGEYQKPDGTYRQEFFDMVTDFENRVAYAAKNTDLPKEPDFDKVQELTMEINDLSLRFYP